MTDIDSTTDREPDTAELQSIEIISIITVCGVCVICSTILVMVILYQRYWSSGVASGPKKSNSDLRVVVSLERAMTAPKIKHSVRLKDIESEEDEDYKILFNVGRQLKPALPPIKAKQKPCHDEESLSSIFYHRGLDTSVLREIDLGDTDNSRFDSFSNDNRREAGDARRTFMKDGEIRFTK